MPTWAAVWMPITHIPVLSIAAPHTFVGLADPHIFPLIPTPASPSFPIMTTPDLDSAPNSLPSSPSGDPPPPPLSCRQQQDDTPRVRLMCSLGGRILPRPQDNQLRYVGGDTRIVAIHRTATYSTLHEKLTKLASSPDVTIKYQLPDEDLDALISITGDEDVENMMEEHARLVSAGAAGSMSRLRVFIFPAGGAGGFGSVLSGSESKRDSWFLDVLNGRTSSLDRGRSDVSSLISEVPDYLFGLDNSSEEPRPKPNASEPGSPAQATYSPKYSSASSVTAPPPDFPPRSEAGYAPNPVWQYVQEPAPVYYMPSPVRPGPLPYPVPYFNPVQPAPGGAIYRPPVQGVWANPVHAGSVYMGGLPAAVEAYQVAAGGALLSGPGVVPLYTGTGIAPAGGGTAAMGRGSQN